MNVALSSSSSAIQGNKMPLAATRTATIVHAPTIVNATMVAPTAAKMEQASLSNRNMFHGALQAKNSAFVPRRPPMVAAPPRSSNVAMNAAASWFGGGSKEVTIKADRKTITIPKGDLKGKDNSNLRRILLDNNVPVYKVLD